MSIWIVGLFFALVIPSGQASAGEARAEDIFPETTFAAVLVPDLAQARSSASQSRLAEMYAQPEMQEFLRPALEQLKKTYAGLREKNVLIPSLDDLDAGLLSGEVAVAIYARPQDALNPVGIIATLKPKDPDAFKRLLPANMQGLLIDGAPIPAGPRPQDPALLYMRGRILVCVPQADIGACMARTKDPVGGKSLAANAEYAELRGKLSNSVCWVYTSPARSKSTWLNAASMAANVDTSKIDKVMAQLGIDNITVAGLGIGFSHAEPVVESYFGFAAPPKEGIFGLFTPGTPGDAPAGTGLKIAAADAPYVNVFHFNSAGMLPLLFKVADAGAPEIAPFLEQFQQMARIVLQFDPQKDFLENLGDEVVVAQSAVDTSAPLSFTPGLVFSLPAKNPAKLEDCLKKIGAALARADPNELGRFKLKQIPHRGKTIYYLSGPVFAGPVSFSVTADRLLASTSLNAMRRGLEQLEKNDSILATKSFQETMARVTGKPFDAAALPAVFSYSLDKGSGNGTLLLTALGLTGSTAALGGLAALPSPADANEPPAFNGAGDPLNQFIASPPGKAVMAVAQAIDLGLWPDEGFFVKYRQASAAYSEFGPKFIYSKTELPPPGPVSPLGIQPATVVAGVAIVAAISIPSLLRSRMAANETASAAACKAFAEAEEIYHRTDYNQDGVLEYSQSFKGDYSLLENKAGQSDLGFIDRNFANAEAGPQAVPKAGYFFKVLKAQGPKAPGGKRSYMPDGKHMTLGYALVAYPAKYDGTGRNTFIINNNGTIFQCDLGADTSAIVEKMTEFNPDADQGWVPTE